LPKNGTLKHLTTLFPWRVLCGLTSSADLQKLAAFCPPPLAR